MKHSTRAALFLIAAGALGGCGSGPLNSTETPTPNWDRPFLSSGAVQLSNISVASDLAFTPVNSNQLPGLLSTWEQKEADPSLNAIGWVYDYPGVGHFLITEERPQMTEQQLEAFPSQAPGQGNTANLSLVPIRNGQTALLIGPKNHIGVNSIEWIEGGVQVTILGQAPAFTNSVAVQAADQL